MASIVIYTTPTCPWCKKTKAFLRGKGLTYKEKDVISSRKNADEMIKKSRQSGVPVLDINGTIVIGYDPDGIMQAVKKGKGKKQKR